jgi:hypothetical protein
MDNVQDDIQEFHTLHPQKKLKALSIIAVIFALSIGAGLYFAGQSGLRKAPSDVTKDTNKGMSQLSIVPESPSIAKGGTTKVSVNMNDTGAQAVDVVITFDPKLVAISEITNGDVFPDILRSEVVNNQVIVSAAVDPNNPAEVKTGTLFSFTLKGVSVGSAALNFDKDLTITATNGVNTLGMTEPVTITVK